MILKLVYVIIVYIMLTELMATRAVLSIVAYIKVHTPKGSQQQQQQ